MSGRVLNFFEFSDKYSTGNSDPLGVDNISNAAANFEEGFDDSTYEQPDLGPKRPVSGGYEATPAVPGEVGAPAFSPGAKPGMEAPEEEEQDEELEEDEEIEEEDDDSGNPEGEEEEEEKVEESFKLVKSFSAFVNESWGPDSFEYAEDTFGGGRPEDGEGYSDDDYEDDDHYVHPSVLFGGTSFGANPEGDDIVNQVEDAVTQLSDDEKAMIADYLSKDPEAFQEMVEDELEQSTDAGANPRGSMGMGREEFETRKIIDKIIKGIAIGSTLAIVPAAMFISGGLALALGITGVVGGIAKDAAWMKKGGHHYRAQDRADSGMDYPEDEEYGMYPKYDDEYSDDEENEFCSNCGAVVDQEYGYSCGCNM
jgi:hypothetical protein